MDPHTLASQLRHPSGEHAAEVALNMNSANGQLNVKCINLLNLQHSESLLEIGPGNGVFAADIIKRADNLSYTGVDWSADMIAEAKRMNEDIVTSGQATFQQGNSSQLNFDSNVFDKILTVHTLYFWDKPLEHLAEIRRVLKPQGLFCLAFGDSSFMKDLPFVPYGFELYDKELACNLLQESGFRLLNAEYYVEQGVSNTGEVVDKIINIIICEA
ncbi:UNVERIFIED_ORG: methyltransferase family protein [Idiomarina abyssalis]|jgi:ubiquinone/menaquinone biosynthesis C-methylase UbiE|uniref:class I SAM-dependent methyltransferase n=2 Tax=unclassified Idiomarina TaxID=2614829 RepID=UPI000C413ED4|nr:MULTISPECIES: class I SAM-dependent methyltransferase [unclassified Idiomarina]MAA62456.1 SAM-dependent methyltransferase [Idiomarina sp.]TDO53388.1 methyltransferase family protein [Idiomarina sp. 017G]|tara:strand:- start:16445 stop:17089 length:645 start_codon:yes stop_codon:yes gene_type:complete